MPFTGNESRTLTSTLTVLDVRTELHPTRSPELLHYSAAVGGEMDRRSTGQCVECEGYAARDTADILYPA